MSPQSRTDPDAYEVTMRPLLVHRFHRCRYHQQSIHPRPTANTIAHTVIGVDPTVVSPGAIWWRDSRGYCLDCLMNSTRLKRRADQSSSIATWRTLSNPA